MINKVDSIEEQLNLFTKEAEESGPETSDDDDDNDGTGEAFKELDDK